MELEVIMDDEAKKLMETLPMARQATRRGLLSAGAAFMDAVNGNFSTQGHGAWRALSPLYRERKMSGKVQGSRQLPSTASGLPDNMMTGALRIAAAYSPISRLTRNSLTITVRGTFALQRRKGSPVTVKRYASHVQKARPFYAVTSADAQRMAEEFLIGFLNYLYGVPDKVGEDLQST